MLFVIEFPKTEECSDKKLEFEISNELFSFFNTF